MTAPLGNDVLRKWCVSSNESQDGWERELLLLGSSQLPKEHMDIAKWAALAFRRDLLAILASKPPHGLEELPGVLPAWKTFDHALTETLRKLELRCHRAAEGLPLNHIHGAWEGGQLQGDLPSNQANSLQTPKVGFLDVTGGL